MNVPLTMVVAVQMPPALTYLETSRVHVSRDSLEMELLAEVLFRKVTEKLYNLFC